ncbi:MAG TPA: sensor histidine kinase [Actinomycetota bacterium]
MSTTSSSQLSRRLAAVIRNYLSGSEEEGLLLAYETGRSILETGTGVLGIAVAYREALEEVFETHGADPVRVFEAAGIVLAEILGPIEMALRGFREANASLSRMNEGLERKVAARTRSLERSLARLREVDAERRRLMVRAMHAQEEERQRIASEIHDDPIQVMTAVGMRIQAMRHRLAADPEHLRMLDRLDETTQLAVRRLRNLMFQLRPRMLDRDGLAATLRTELEKLSEETGATTGLEDRMSGEPPPDTRAVLYRIAREALTNARKHSGAGRVNVELERRDQGVLVRVTDDGDGFDERHLDEASPRHAGLLDMQERAAMVQGKLRITSEPGSGTTVEIWVPVTPGEVVELGDAAPSDDGQGEG